MRALTALLAALVLVASGCGGDDESASETTGAASDECTQVDTPEARDPGTNEAPSASLDPDTTYTLTFETSCGSFIVTLDPTSAPNTTASLVALADAGYFDDTIFHRVVPGFVIQGGDPTQTGGGGPGYSTVDAPPSDASYTEGVVAMAKTEVEPAGTAGSQFFVVSGLDARTLSPDYAIVGEVTAGMDTVERIDAVGASQTVVVESVTVGRS